MKNKCTRCSGDGWYADHSFAHYANNHALDCSEFGCPVQVQCEECMGTGYIMVELIDTEI